MLRHRRADGASLGRQAINKLRVDSVQNDPSLCFREGESKQSERLVMSNSENTDPAGADVIRQRHTTSTAEPEHQSASTPALKI